MFIIKLNYKLIKYFLLIIMSSFKKIRMMCNADANNKPTIGHTYSLIYIKGDDLSECLGNENSTEFYICENKKLVGQLKSNVDIQIIKEKINNLQLSTVVKIGIFEVKKIILWGKNKSQYSIHGLPLLNDLLFDEDTIIIQEKINELIQKYNWKLER